MTNSKTKAFIEKWIADLQERIHLESAFGEGDKETRKTQHAKIVLLKGLLRSVEWEEQK